MRNFLGDFKKFILRGNVIDLAVAVIVGAAFTAVVKSFANDVIMGFIGAIFGQPNFNEVSIHVGDGRVYVGRFFTDARQLHDRRVRGLHRGQGVRGDAADAPARRSRCRARRPT